MVVTMVTLPWSLSAHNQIPFRDAAMHDEHASGRHTHDISAGRYLIRRRDDTSANSTVSLDQSGSDEGFKITYK
ncbi:hypothetical protein VTN96DRAFT_6408 [Rasamsonia emersonii]